MCCSNSELHDEAVRILCLEFPEVRPVDVAMSVFHKGCDPGGWSTEALLTVHLERGLPDVFNYPRSHLAWERVENQLSEIYGKELFFESINSAVTALWEV